MFKITLLLRDKFVMPQLNFG